VVEVLLVGIVVIISSFGLPAALAELLCCTVRPALRVTLSVMANLIALVGATAMFVGRWVAELSGHGDVKGYDIALWSIVPLWLAAQILIWRERTFSRGR
jgi:hypothetical protein